MRIRVNLDYGGDFEPIKHGLAATASSPNNVFSAINEASNQVDTGAGQVFTVVQTNAATAEEDSASSKELTAQAQALQREIARFKLVDYDSTVKLFSCEETETGAEVDEIAPESRVVPTAGREKY